MRFPLVAAAAAIAIAAAAFWPGSLAASAPLPEMGAIGKLVVGGDRLCTAFVVASERVTQAGPYGYRWEPVWENLAVSAGHCFDPEMQFRSNRTPASGPPGREAWYPAETFPARVVAVSRPPLGWDLMVVAFYSYWQLPALRIASEPPERGEILLMVGYGGGVLGAVSGRFLGTDGDGSLMVGARGVAGYSGGPVMRADGAVVGVAAAVKLKEPRPAIHCALGACEFDQVYYAVPVSRLEGLVRLSPNGNGAPR
jgi:hypothetical protein